MEEPNLLANEQIENINMNNALNILRDEARVLTNNNNRLRQVRLRQRERRLFDEERERQERVIQERVEIESKRRRLRNKNIYNLRDALDGHILYLQGLDIRNRNNEGLPRQNINYPRLLINNNNIRGFLTESLTSRTVGSLYRRVTLATMTRPLETRQILTRTRQVIDRIRHIRIILEELSTRKYPGREEYIRYSNEELRNWLINQRPPPSLLRTITPNRENIRRSYD